MCSEKRSGHIRHLEHSSFVGGIDQAFETLANAGQLSYRDVLETHKVLFGDMYPWAGQDRSQTAPDLAISRGPALFAHPKDAKIARAGAVLSAQEPPLARGGGPNRTALIPILYRPSVQRRRK